MFAASSYEVRDGGLYVYMCAHTHTQTFNSFEQNLWRSEIFVWCTSYIHAFLESDILEMTVLSRLARRIWSARCDMVSSRNFFSTDQIKGSFVSFSFFLLSVSSHSWSVHLWSVGFILLVFFVPFSLVYTNRELLWELVYCFEYIIFLFKNWGSCMWLYGFRFLALWTNQARQKCFYRD